MKVRVKRIIIRFFILSAVIIGVSACSPQSPPSPFDAAPITSFRDVPGITEDEINAIEALQKQTPHFIYGMIPGTESFLKENGEIGGYTARVCEWLTELFGIKFVPQLFEWDDLLAKVTNGEIHFTGEMTATEERRKIYYMSDPIANRMVKIMRVEGGPSLAQIAQTRPLRYAFLEGAVTLKDVTGQLEPGSFEAVMVNDHGAAYRLLINGEVDAYIAESTDEASFDPYGNVVITDFIPLIFSSVSLTTGIPELAPVISVVTKALRGNAIRHLTKLYNLGYEEYRTNRLWLRFTEEEREYIKNNPVVRMGALHYNYPVDFYNDHEGEWQGIIFDILKEVTALTGLSFEVANDTYMGWPDLFQSLERGEVSFVPHLVRTPAREGRFLWPQTAKMQDSYLLISKSEFPNLKINDVLGIRVALIKDYAHVAMFHKWFPNHAYTVEYESIKSAVDALERNEVDVMIGSMIQLLALTNYQERIGYKANLVFGLTYDVTTGFNKNEAVLLSILDKTYAQIDINRISEYWVRKTYDYQAKLLQAQRPWLFGAIGLILIILALVSVLFMRSRNTERNLEKVVTQRTNELQTQAKELARQSSLLQTMIDSIPNHIFCKDLDSKFTLCNKNMADYFNLAEDSIIGKSDMDGLGMPIDMAEAIRSADLTVIDERKQIVVEEWIPSVHGERRLFETVKAPLVQDGAVIGLIGIGHDITERKAMEEEARSASRSKSAFLATMSHEIRTPMNSIMGFAELAMSSGSVRRIKDYLGKITESTKWLLRIINDVLDISKIESGRMELEKIPFDLHGIISRCQSVILPEIKERGLDLRLYVEPPVGKKLLGDPVRLYQAIMNLLSNAVKFTSDGTIKFTSMVKDMNGGGAIIYFEVRDTGIGMSPEQVKKIFEPFTQADSSTTRRYGGTGLGLTIVKNIVEIMGGKLAVESSPGAGSVFSFEVPFETIDVSSAFESKDIILEKPRFDGLVLVCDDNIMNQEVICEHLADVGLRTVVAGNGKAGVDIVWERMRQGQEPFDLIFMDMFMPVMDGTEAAVKIASLDTGTPIVAVTANVMASELENYKKHGMPDCLGKPFTSQELWRVLLKYLVPLDSSAIDEDGQERDRFELQNKLRLNFVKSYQNIYIDITEAIARGDIKLAHRLTHTLKGNAGMIDEPGLQNIAAEVETQLRNGAASIPEGQLKLLEAELTRVLEELKPLLDKSAEQCMAVLSAGQISALIEKIEPMLANINPGVVYLLDDIRAIPGSEELVRQIEDYDFKAAVGTLCQLKEEMGTES